MIAPARKPTVRFRQVVERCGQPETAILWLKHKPDRSFSKALREERLMSIKQAPVGNKADYGTVGYLEEKNVSYLIFPRSLAEYKDQRIVAIDYDLLAVPENPRPGKPEPEPKPAPKPKAKPASAPVLSLPPPLQPLAPLPLRRYRVMIRSVATFETVREVDAHTVQEAERIVQREVTGNPPALTDTQWVHRVSRVERLDEAA